MKKPTQNEKNARPKRNAACKVQTYNILQSGYYNEQRDLKRALKFSLIEAKAAQNRQKNLDSKKKDQVKKVKEYLKDENKDKSIGKVIDKVIANGMIEKQTNDKANETVQPRRFTAHRKFAQNCQPYSNGSLPVDFKEKDQLCTKLPVKQSNCAELFPDPKLTTDDFLTYLCFREYVPLPLSFVGDKEMSKGDSDSIKETRKENSSDLIETKEWDCKEKVLKENEKKVKLNGVSSTVSSKKAMEIKDDKVDLTKVDKVKGKMADKIGEKMNQKIVQKVNQKMNQKINQKMNQKLNNKISKLNSVKLNQIKNQFKNSATKVNQLKSNKLTKLAKMNKVKNIEKKISETKPTNGHLHSKKKVDIKLESSSNSKSTTGASSIESTIDEIIKQSIEMNEKEEKITPKLVTSKSFTSLSSSTSSSKFIPPKCSSSKLSANLPESLKLKMKKKKKKNKEFIKLKKEEVKAKKQFMNTRKLRNGKSHHYQSKN